jgi:hypothetical protein
MFIMGAIAAGFAAGRIARHPGGGATAGGNGNVASGQFQPTPAPMASVPAPTSMNEPTPASPEVRLDLESARVNQ